MKDCQITAEDKPTPVAENPLLEPQTPAAPAAEPVKRGRKAAATPAAVDPLAAAPATDPLSAAPAAPAADPLASAPTPTPAAAPAPAAADPLAAAPAAADPLSAAPAPAAADPVASLKAIYMNKMRVVTESGVGEEFMKATNSELKRLGIARLSETPADQCQGLLSFIVNWPAPKADPNL